MTAPARRQMPPLPPLEAIRNVHIIGICGTAMGSLAALLAERGLRVRGTDTAAYEPMNSWLADRGLAILPGWDPAAIAPDTDLVVVGNVARRDNPEVLEAARRGLPALSMPEVLRALVFPGRTVLAVTGTHGKTTTSSMTAWLLDQAGQDPGFFIGGITGNFGSNYRIGTGNAFVIEGDEYDTAWFDKVPKFWHYPAVAATINNVEFDHADIYPSLDDIRHVFTRFAEQLPRNGLLAVNGDDPVALDCAAHAACQRVTFGLGPGNALRATELAPDGDGMRASVHFDGELLGEVHVPMPGAYNVRNFLGAALIARFMGVPLTDSLRAISGFRGVRRRQELICDVGGVTVIDDFAHHPTAVRNTLDAVRARYPGRPIHAVFEAKSNTSRRAVFQQDYANALADCAHVVLSPPWKRDALPESELLSIPRLVDDLLQRGVDARALPSVDEILAHLVATTAAGDVVVLLSGSAFEGLAARLGDGLRARFTPTAR